MQLIASIIFVLGVLLPGTASASADQYCEALLCMASKNPDWTEIPYCAGRSDFEGLAKYRGGPVYSYIDYLRHKGELPHCASVLNNQSFSIDITYKTFDFGNKMFHGRVQLKSNGKILNEHEF